jgi:hypothetical protein
MSTRATAGCLAPALVHNVSFAGDGNRPRVNCGFFDLYTGYAASDIIQGGVLPHSTRLAHGVCWL